MFSRQINKLNFGKTKTKTQQDQPPSGKQGPELQDDDESIHDASSESNEDEDRMSE